MVGNDDLSLLQELVSHADAFTQQSAGILPQVEDQPVDVAQLIQRLPQLVLGGLLETGDVDVADAGANQEMHVHAVAGNLVAHDGEVEGLVGTFAQHGDLDGGALGAFQQLRHIAGAHVVGRLAVDRDDDIARADARAIGGRTGKGRDHDDFVIARTNLHAHAVILAALLLAQGRVGFGIEEVGVRIEHPQHAGNRPVVDGLVRVDRLGIVLLHHVVNIGEAAQAFAHVAVAGGCSWR